jgi:nitroreductase
MSEVRQNPVEHPVPEAIRLRWSPVAFVPEPMDDATLHAVFEGARWAASAFNEQPWRFVVARRQDEARFSSMLDCLVDANRAWAQHASVVAIVCARAAFARNGKPNAHAWFDTGQATAQLMLSAIRTGLYSHAMGGFDADKARAHFGIPEGFDPVCAIAVGRLGDGSLLEPDTAARDQSPRVRKSLDEIVFEGTFTA